MNKLLKYGGYLVLLFLLLMALDKMSDGCLYNCKGDIKITHNAGFFSCCSVRLSEIIDFINSNKRLPDNVDSSEQFEIYKKTNEKNKDITFDYFENYNIVKDVNIIHPIN